MTDRGISTVLDVSACLLLVTSAVLVLVGASPPPADPATGRAEAATTTLAATTTTVAYPAGDRTARVHGTHAQLLGAAAVSNATPSTGQPFRTAVANVTAPHLGGPEWRTQVVVEWRPYGRADDGGTVTVGDAPPPGVDVHAASMHAASGVGPVRKRARTAARADGYDGVASVLAAALDDVLGDGRVEGRERLERRLVADLRASYETPAAAAADVQVGRVAVTVRTWSP